MRGARKTLGKTYPNNQAPSIRLSNNVEASPQQLGEGKTQEMKTESQTFVCDYDEHACRGSLLTLIKLYCKWYSVSVIILTPTPRLRERCGRYQRHIVNLA